MKEKILNHVFRAFNIRHGEGLPIFYLLTLSLFTGIFVAFYLSAANASFLSNFEIDFLPWAYIISGLVGNVAVAVFSYLQKRVPFTRLLVGNVLFLFALLITFRTSLLVTDSRWISFLMFIWIDPMLTLLDLGYWGLAGRLFDLQQGKRLFGLVSSGEVVTAVLGFFLVPFCDYSILLVIAAFGLGLYVFAMMPAVRHFRERLLATSAPAPRRDGDEQVAGTDNNRYFMLISIVTVLVILALYFVDFVFLRNASQRYVTETSLASFLAIFFAITRLTELVAKTLLSGRLIGQFGLIFGLLALPVSVMVFGLAAAATWIFGSAGTWFFVFVALGKLLEFVLRKSIFDPSFKVLFQPVDERQRFAMQTRAEGSVRQVGLLLAGAALVMISFFDAMDVEHVVYLQIFVALGCTAVTVLLFREYRSKLLEALSRHTGARLLESPVQIIRRVLLDARAQPAGYTLNVLGRVEPVLFVQFLEELATSEDPAVRQVALQRIHAFRLFGFLDTVSRQAADDPDRDVRQAAAELVGELREVKAFLAAPDRVVALASSERADDRVLAALAFVYEPRIAPPEALFELLWDSTTRVRRVALIAAGQSRHEAVWPRLIEQLGSGLFSEASASALITIGSPVLDALDSAFRRFEEQPEAMLRILRIYERIDDDKAGKLLFDQIDHPNRDVRQQALESLSVCGYQAQDGQVRVVRYQIEKALDHLSWYLAAQLDIGLEAWADDLARALEGQILQERQSLLLLLGLICDPEAIRLMRDSLSDEDAGGQAYALEIATEVIPSELQGALFPFLEQLPPRQTLDRLDLFFPQLALSPSARLRDILRQGYGRVNSWTKACAIRTLSEFGGASIPIELAANLFNQHPMIRELTALAMNRLDPPACRLHLDRLPAAQAAAFDSLIRAAAEGALSIFDKVLLLRSTEIFAPIPEPMLARSAAGIQELRFSGNERIFSTGDPAESMFVIAQGRIRIEKDGVTLTHLTDRDVLGEIGILEAGVRSAAAVVEEPTQLLHVDQKWLYDLLADRMEILPRLIEVITKRLARA